MAEKKKARGIKLAAASLAMVVVGSGAALAATIPGTNAARCCAARTGLTPSTATAGPT
jgi:hypothetical protein